MLKEKSENSKQTLIFQSKINFILQHSLVDFSAKLMRDMPEDQRKKKIIEEEQKLQMSVFEN